MKYLYYKSTEPFGVLQGNRTLIYRVNKETDTVEFRINKNWVYSLYKPTQLKTNIKFYEISEEEVFIDML